VLNKMTIRSFINKLACCFRDSRGITLIEVVLAIGLGSMVISAASFTLNHVLVAVPKEQGQMLAIRQAQSAGYWIDRDGSCARTITPEPGLFTLSTGTPLVISYYNWDATKVTINYVVDADHVLQRQMVVINEKTGAEVSSSQMRVADSISSITAKYDYLPGNDIKRVLTVTITVQVGSASKTRIYYVTPRQSVY
jgi:hypothetical protein